MKREVGLWIDHRQSVIVSVTDAGVAIRCISSNMERHVRYAGGASQHGSAEDQRDRQFAGHLDKYYDEVVRCIGDAESILILGPGEAKGELEKRLDSVGLGDRIEAVEAADKMTDAQITARVLQHFRKEARRDRTLRTHEVHPA
jgi:hypothetical protein